MAYRVIFDSSVQEERVIPFENVWYCYKKGRKYVVRESEIRGIWATNIVGIILDNNWHISENEFNRLFKDKNKAIDWCVKQNQRGTVKVYKRW